MKKFSALALTLLMLLSVVAVNAQSSIGVVIDGENVVFTDVFPFINEDNRTLVPLRAIGEAMGLNVDWLAKENKAVFSRTYTWEDSPLYRDTDGNGEYDTYLGKESVTFTIGENIAVHDMVWYDKSTSPDNGFPLDGGISEIQMDTVAINKDSRTYAPVRYLAEAFRYDVNWDGATNSVTMNYMYSVYELGIQTELVACWEDSQSWMFTANEQSEIQSMDILSVSIDKEDFQYSLLTQDDQNTIYESGEEFGKYLNGFLVYNQIENNTYHDYKVKFRVIFSDGTQKLGFVNIGLYFDGGQGGYI